MQEKTYVVAMNPRLVDLFRRTNRLDPGSCPRLTSSRGVPQGLTVWVVGLVDREMALLLHELTEFRKANIKYAEVDVPIRRCDTRG